MHEAVIHVDFSENYVCHNASEIQCAHFGASNHQVTLHNGVLYQTGTHSSFATVSHISASLITPLFGLIRSQCCWSFAE